MSIQDLTKVAMMTAMLGVLGAIPPIPIPITPVPITVQSIGPMIIGGILGGKRGLISVLLFLFLVACSLPLLAGGRGGIGVLLGPTGGFVFGWALVALAIGLTVARMKKRTFLKVFIVNIVFGIGLLYICGAGFLAATSGFTFIEAMGLNLVYVPGDLIKAAVAAIITIRVLKAVKTI